MIRYLVRKEALNNITNFRFIVSGLIALLLIILTTFIIAEKYMKEVDQYNEFIAADQQSLGDIKAYAELQLNAHRPPNPLIIFDSGISENLDNSVVITHQSVPRQGLEADAENPFTRIFNAADLVTIFRIVFSLLAILMVYDAVAGEREEGTLGAALANAVPRDSLLLSKFIAGFIGILLAMLIGLLVSLLVLQLVYGISFSSDQWLRIIFILVSSLLFMGFFLALGILVSSRVRTASISLIWLLFIWVFTVIIQPNLSTYVGSAVVRIPSREQIEGAIAQNWDEYRAKHQELEAKIREEVPGDPWHTDHDSSWPFYVCFDGNTCGLLRYVYRTQRIMPVFISYAEKEYQVYRNEYEVYLDRQLAVQRICNYLSPAGLFRRITSSLAETDINHHELYMDQARQFRSTFLSYLTNEKKVFSENANLYFTQRTMDQIIHNDYEERLAKRRQGVETLTYGRDSCEPFDLSDVPRFSYREPGVAASLHFVFLDLLVLLVLTAVIFYLSVISFHRYDVRQNS
ncbi:ABC transporter permease subunit [bacterium]|nr:ABC transporter permease subunit [bacterium]